MKRILSLGWRLAAGAIIALALLIALLRLFAPLLGTYREEIAQEIGTAIGQTVEIGALGAEWAVFAPRLHLREVTVRDREGGILLALETVRIDIDMVASLLERGPRIASMAVSGGDLHLLRREDGGLELQGITLRPTARGPEGVAPSLDLRFTNARLRWEDRIFGHDWQIEEIGLRIALDAGGVRLAAEFTPPGALGRRVALGADLSGDPLRPVGLAGDLYLRGEGIDLQALAGEAGPRLESVRGGQADVELWGDLREGRLLGVQGEVKAKGLLAETEKGRILLDTLGGRVSWRADPGGWTLDMVDLHVARDGHEWVAKGLGVAVSEAAGTRTLRIAGDYLYIQDIAAIAALHVVGDEGPGAAVVSLLPGGELLDFNLHARIPETGTPEYRFDGEVREFGFEPHEKRPGLRGLSAQISADAKGGQALIGTTGLRLDYPALFVEPLWIDDAEGRVSWTLGEAGIDVLAEDLQLRNADIRAWGGFSLLLAGEDSSLDLAIHYADGNGASTRRYLPARIMPPRTHAWLERSIVAGHVVEGGAVFRGRFRDFPFRDGEGIFVVRSHIEKGILDYQPDWPRLEDASLDLVFRNNSMFAESIRAAVFGTRIVDAEVRIDDLKRAVLEIRGEIEGPLAGMMRFLDESPLGRGREALIREPRFGGDARLDLGIRMPLAREEIRNTAVQGEVVLEGNRLEFPGEGIAFEGVKGTARFTEATVDARGVTGSFRGRTVTADARKAPGRETEVDLRARLGVEAIAPDLPAAWKGRIRGDSDWTATIVLPPEEAVVRGARLRAASSLQGLQLDLPAPFGKEAEERRMLTAEIPIGAAAGQVAFFSLGEGLSAALEFERPPEGRRLLRGELRLEHGRPTLPDAGIRVVGRIDHLDLDAWRALAGDVPVVPAARPLGEPLLREVNLAIGGLDAGGRIFPSVELKALYQPEHWAVVVRSPAVAGRIEYPHDIRTRPLVADLDHLITRHIREGAAGPEAVRDPDPRDLPAMQVASREFELGGSPLGTLRFETSRLSDGQRIDLLRLSGTNLFVEGEGSWRILRPGLQQTQIGFTLTSEDIGQALSTLGFTHAFAEGKGRVDGSLIWPNMPQRFDWRDVDGDVKIDLRDGRLVEVKPGAGRILGLFSLQALPRRLILDFGDFLQKGFSFDRMKGTAILDDGDAVTEDLFIEGPSARVEIRGRTGIAARDQDLQVVVTPKVTSTLPIAGAVLGGPAAGAAIFLADKLFKGMGRRIDASMRVEYHVTGAWDEPLIETVRQE